jgi:outer membrane protein OmpA-like peptidoglycan-associated protein
MLKEKGVSADRIEAKGLAEADPSRSRDDHPVPA